MIFSRKTKEPSKEQAESDKKRRDTYERLNAEGVALKGKVIKALN